MLHATLHRREGGSSLKSEGEGELMCRQAITGIQSSKLHPHQRTHSGGL